MSAALPAYRTTVSTTAVTAVSKTATRSVFSRASNSPNTTTAEVPAQKRTKTARVNIIVEPHPRTAKKFGRECHARIFLLCIQRRTTPEIMAEIGCSRDFVEDVIRTWETQAEIVVKDMKDRPQNS